MEDLCPEEDLFAGTCVWSDDLKSAVQAGFRGLSSCPGDFLQLERTRGRHRFRKDCPLPSTSRGQRSTSSTSRRKMTSSRFLVGMLAMLAMLAVVVGQVEPESELDCYDGPFENVLLDGCVDDCQSFESLADAEAHCNSIAMCGGITKTAYGDEEAVSLGVGLYEVRAGPGIETAQGDQTWIKQVDCASGTQGGGEAAALGDLDRMVQNGQLAPEGDSQDEGQYTEGDICRTYSAPVQGRYLEGCVDECRSFETLQEAEDHCDRVADCGGVTHSLYGEGQAWHDGVGPYEVRRGPALKASADGDMTWIRVEHACDDDTQGGLGAWEGSFSSSVEEAETSLVSTVSWMVVIGMLVGGTVLFSYKKGHPATVTYVDRAHDELKKVMGRSGVQIPGGGAGYESL